MAEINGWRLKNIKNQKKETIKQKVVTLKNKWIYNLFAN
jgi:hypothetical protein